MVLDASLLNTQHYKVRIKGKVEQSREGVAPSPTHWCSSYRKGSLRVTLDYGRQLYLLFTYFIYIYIYIIDTEAKESSVVDVKADEPNDGATIRLSRRWPEKSHGTTARIK